MKSIILLVKLTEVSRSNASFSAPDRSVKLQCSGVKRSMPEPTSGGKFWKVLAKMPEPR